MEDKGLFKCRVCGKEKDETINFPQKRGKRNGAICHTCLCHKYNRHQHFDTSLAIFDTVWWRTPLTTIRNCNA